MRRTALVAHCLTKPGAYLDHPWGEEDSVVKVGGKIFPDHIGPGPYLNKQLWSRIDLSTPGGPDEDEARELIDDSYDLIVASLPRAKRPAVA